MLVYLISVAISGLIVGALARAVIPGRQEIGIFPTIGLGLVGSILGGIVGGLLFGGAARYFGLILAVAAAAGVLWLAIKQGWVRST
ncbi:MAG: GlsB/YeaQ/YmgE family stress response membrane protein [Acidimicrobiia bacterium]